MVSVVSGEAITDLSSQYISQRYVTLPYIYISQLSNNFNICL